MAPTMAGFFEFSLMRLDGRFDKHLLSELYYQYINTEDAFTRTIFTLEPSIYRAFVQEAAIGEKDRVVVLDYERASRVIDTATCITVGTCYCRHKMQHVGKACRNPQDVCLTFNKSAESLSKHGVARQIDRPEAHQILDRCIRLGLVQLGDNVQEGVNWICNCCSCCCEALLSYRKLGYNARITTNFVVHCTRRRAATPAAPASTSARCRPSRSGGTPKAATSPSSTTAAASAAASASGSARRAAWLWPAGRRPPSCPRTASSGSS